MNRIQSFSTISTICMPCASPALADRAWEGHIRYLTPADKLNGLEQVILADRDGKLEQARLRRQQARQAAREVA